MGVFQIGKPGTVLMKILQVANYSEGCGGISVQVQLLRNHLIADGLFCEIISTKGSVIKRLRSIIKLFTKGRRFDVFHVHACSDRGFFPAIVGISIGRVLKKRVVLTFHGGGGETFFRRRTALVRHYLTRTGANIVLSGFIGDIYDKYQIPYTIIPNIIDLKEGIYKEREDICPRFISIRSLSEIYNVECTLRAFQRVQSLYPDATLSLLGDGPLEGRLETFVKDHHIKNVTFVGRVNNDEIYHYLARCDIMVSSSRFDNMPVSILEGFNAGLLVIASNVGGVPYMIKNGVNGLLFESDNDEEMAAKMIYAIENPEEVRMMINHARQTLIEYSWAYIRPMLMNLYQGQ